MSITHPARRRPAATLSSLAYAAVLGAAASVIHGAFDGAAGRRGRTVRRGSPPARSKDVSSRGEDSTAGKGAAEPSDIPAPGWWAILKRTFSEVNSDRVLAVAGGVTFYSLLALFPAVTVLVSLYGLFADQQTISDHLQLLAGFLPQGAMSIISEQVTRIAKAGHTGLGLAAIGGLLVAIWSSNSAMKAMMDALNIAYDADEKRGFIKLNLVSLAFTLSGIIGLILMFAVVAVVPAVLHLVMLGPIADVLLAYGRWPVIFVLMLLALAVLYRYGPSRPEVAWKWITPGSLLASVALIIFSMLFSWYAANFGKFNETYGSLGAAIGFMTWLWLSATIVLVGAELNAEVENQARVGPKPGEAPGGPDAKKKA